MLSDLCGAPVSAGSVAGWVEQAADRLNPFLARLTDGRRTLVHAVASFALLQH